MLTGAMHALIKNGTYGRIAGEHGLPSWQCNPLETPEYFGGCCYHTEKVKFLMWHRVHMYTMEQVLVLLAEVGISLNARVFGWLFDYLLIF